MTEPGADELLFLPLGGSGEIGMNLNLYGHAGRWLMIDLGIAFGDDDTPGIEVVMPDPGFIAERRDRLDGLVLTHGHEDHIGAVPYLWPALRCPIYATPFTAALVRRKLAEVGLEDEAVITEIPMSGRVRIGPFEIELVTLTHSIPEPNAVVVRTPLGTVLHTGDWKLDPEPLIGEPADAAALRRLGSEGVLAMVCDSTNALVEGHSGSEADVRTALDRLIGGLKQRVAVACFASNVARLDTVARIAARHGRHVGLVGRSLWRIDSAARETGYLADLPPFVSEHELGFLPRDRALMVCTGSQGEPRSALARIARDDHPQVTLEAGDAVIFSSRVIPGNERAIFKLQDDLVRLGVEVLTDREHPVHVSGHPARAELAEMYHWVRPRIAVPVHGEPRHLVAHAQLARDCQVPQAVVPENGALIRLAPGPAEQIGEVPAGRLGLDGSALVPVGGALMQQRRRIAYGGVAVLTLVLDRRGALLAEPQLAAPGLLDGGEDADVAEQVVAAVRDAVEALPPVLRREDDSVREAGRLAVRRTFRALRDKKPVTEVQLVRV
ncbi:MAG: ribonuclease J [Dongiaceae bacterium]